MKIVGVSSSPNKNGNTATLLREVLKGARSFGATTEEIILADYTIQFCRGCLSCMVNGGCVINDDFATLKKKIKEADGLVLGSPTYAYSLNGQMKQFFERFGMFDFMTSESFGGKYFVAVATTGGMGVKRTVKNLTGPLKNGIFRRGFESGTVTAATGKTPVAENSAVLAQAFEAGKKLALDIQQNATYPFQNLFHRFIAGAVMRPRFTGFIKAGKDNGRMKAVHNCLSESGMLK